jgi:hypothetical protein
MLCVATTIPLAQISTHKLKLQTKCPYHVVMLAPTGAPLPDVRSASRVPKPGSPGSLLTCACRTLQAQVPALQSRLDGAQVAPSGSPAALDHPGVAGWTAAEVSGGAEGEEAPAPQP